MWGVGAGRWIRALYNHLVGSVIDYFLINLKERSDIIDKESSGNVKRKRRVKWGGNEEAIGNIAEFGPVVADWVVKILKARHQEPAGETHISDNEAIKFVRHGSRK